MEYSVEVGDFVKQGSLDDLCQMVFSHNLQALYYTEVGDQKFLIAFSAATSNSVVNNRNLVEVFITEVIFSPVDAYKRMVVYDHKKGFSQYLDKDKDGSMISDQTMNIPVFWVPCIRVSKIAEKIEKIISNKLQP
ncbi:MAG: hypothetical protein HYW70_02635 [Candidatus Nealsonbacteria bacterium]|nr:hypothetical protein [Candidatus Nealsonbacteria bacterium]